ncbi:MAG: DUF488 domain-containing protein [Actinobacteria bacterium]|nr:DUF488 domain-containing protein [Actinomycetota bacterium]
MRLFTVGHGNRTTDELVAVLADGGVARLVDVRRFPGSRRHPHLARERLVEDLPLAYEWWGEALGGRRKPVAETRHPEWRNDAFRAYADWMDTPVFTDALDRLLETAAAAPTAVMCSETLWWRCHRRLIADAALARGVDVVHLLGVGKVQPHPATLL